MIAWFMGLKMGGKIALILGALAAIAAIIFGINHMIDGFKQAGRDEVMAQWNEEKAARAGIKAEFQVSIASALQEQFQSLRNDIAGIDRQEADINVRLPAIMAHDPRASQTVCDLTPEQQAAANAARASIGSQ